MDAVSGIVSHGFNTHDSGKFNSDVKTQPYAPSSSLKKIKQIHQDSRDVSNRSAATTQNHDGLDKVLDEGGRYYHLSQQRQKGNNKNINTPSSLRLDPIGCLILSAVGIINVAKEFLPNNNTSSFQRDNFLVPFTEGLNASAPFVRTMPIKREVWGVNGYRESPKFIKPAVISKVSEQEQIDSILAQTPSLERGEHKVHKQIDKEGRNTVVWKKWPRTLVVYRPDLLEPPINKNRFFVDIKTKTSHDENEFPQGHKYNFDIENGKSIIKLEGSKHQVFYNWRTKTPEIKLRQGNKTIHQAVAMGPLTLEWHPEVKNKAYIHHSTHKDFLQLISMKDLAGYTFTPVDNANRHRYGTGKIFEVRDKNESALVPAKMKVIEMGGYVVPINQVDVSPNDVRYETQGYTPEGDAVGMPIKLRSVRVACDDRQWKFDLSTPANMATKLLAAIEGRFFPEKISAKRLSEPDEMGLRWEKGKPKTTAYLPVNLDNKTYVRLITSEEGNGCFTLKQGNENVPVIYIDSQFQIRTADQRQQIMESDEIFGTLDERDACQVPVIPFVTEGENAVGFIDVTTGKREPTLGLTFQQLATLDPTKTKLVEGCLGDVSTVAKVFNKATQEYGLDFFMHFLTDKFKQPFDEQDTRTIIHIARNVGPAVAHFLKQKSDINFVPVQDSRVEDTSTPAFFCLDDRTINLTDDFFQGANIEKNALLQIFHEITHVAGSEDGFYYDEGVALFEELNKILSDDKFSDVKIEYVSSSAELDDFINEQTDSEGWTLRQEIESYLEGMELRLGEYQQHLDTNGTSALTYPKAFIPASDYKALLNNDTLTEDQVLKLFNQDRRVKDLIPKVADIVVAFMLHVYLYETQGTHEPALKGNSDYSPSGPCTRFCVNAFSQ